MKLRSLLIIAFLAMGVVNVSAFKFEKENFRWGVTANVNMSKLTSYSNAKFRGGFSVGAAGEYTFWKDMYGLAGLSYTLKGSKYDTPGELKETLGYFEIPINVGYRYGINDKIGVFGETGPYIALGIHGKAKAKGYEDTKVFDDNYGGKRFDMGWCFRAGVESFGVKFHIGYEFGFIKLFEKDAGSPRNANLMIGATYLF